MEESLLHMFLLTCGRERCEELVCDHGTFRAANPSCHENLDESDMFMHFIDFPTPINSICLKCIEKSNIGEKLFMGKSSVNALVKTSDWATSWSARIDWGRKPPVESKSPEKVHV